VDRNGYAKSHQRITCVSRLVGERMGLLDFRPSSLSQHVVKAKGARVTRAVGVSGCRHVHSAKKLWLCTLSHGNRIVGWSHMRTESRRDFSEPHVGLIMRWTATVGTCFARANQMSCTRLRLTYAAEKIDPLLEYVGSRSRRSITKGGSLSPTPLTPQGSDCAGPCSGPPSSSRAWSSWVS
jgi:hypothetical protein